MPVAIVATVGSASANSFVTLAEAATYMEGRLNSDAWDDASPDSQNRALVEATREISAQSGYVGVKADADQALAWPRDWATDPDNPSGWMYENTVIPQRVKDATMELAFQFLKAGTTDIAAYDSTQFVIENTVDVLTTRWAEPHQRPTGLLRYPRVWKLISPLLETSGSQINIVRG